MGEKSVSWNQWNIGMSKNLKKETPFSLQSLVFFNFVYWTKRKITWMHLKLDFRPVISSKGFRSRTWLQLHLVPLLTHLAPYLWAQHKWTHESGFAAWLYLAAGPNVSRQWVTLGCHCARLLSTHWVPYSSVTKTVAQEWCQNLLKLTGKQEMDC